MSFVLVVDGQEFGGWTKAKATRGLDKTSSSFQLYLSPDAANQVEAKRAAKVDDGVECQLYIMGKIAVTGLITKSSGRIDKGAWQVSISGGSKTAKLKGAIDLKSLQWDNKSPSKIAKEILEKTGVKFSDDNTLSKELTRYIARRDESIERALQALYREKGVTITDNEKGEAVALKGGSKGQGDDLILGMNILSMSWDKDWSPKFTKAEGRSSSALTDNNYGAKSADIVAYGEDKEVKSNIIYRYPINSDTSKEDAKKRSKMELERRNAEGNKITVGMFGYTQMDGELFDANYTHNLKADDTPVSGEYLCESVTWQIADKDEYETELTLVNKKAYDAGEEKEDGGADIKAFGSNKAADVKQFGKSQIQGFAGEGSL